MIIEDYTSTYYELILGRPVPEVCEGKFVHILGPPDEFLVLSPAELSKYHANIVERFCHLRDDVSFVLTSDAGHFETPGWRVLGGGRFRLNRDEKILELWGSSKAYGAFDEATVARGVKSCDGWRDYGIRIGVPESTDSHPPA